MKLRRYDIYVAHYDIGDFTEEEERVDGEHTNANDALNIITAQKNRIAELENRVEELEAAVKSFARGACHCDPGYFECPKCRISKFLDEHDGKLEGILKVLCPALFWRPK